MGIGDALAALVLVFAFGIILLVYVICRVASKPMPRKPLDRVNDYVLRSSVGISYDEDELELYWIGGE